MTGAGTSGAGRRVEIFPLERADRSMNDARTATLDTFQRRYNSLDKIVPATPVERSGSTFDGSMVVGG
jgi:hypothetical protein